jgi:hypothetical protein
MDGLVKMAVRYVEQCQPKFVMLTQQSLLMSLGQSCV